MVLTLRRIAGFALIVIGYLALTVGVPFVASLTDGDSASLAAFHAVVMFFAVSLLLFVVAGFLALVVWCLDGES